MGKPQIDTTAVVRQLRIHHPDLTGFRQLTEGEESRAFAFEARGIAYVVRINPSLSGFEKDRWAFEQFNGPDLPVPEIILVEPDDSGAFLCISHRVAGQTLQALPAGDAFAYGAAVGRAMDAMACVTPGGKTGGGPVGADGKSSHDSWPAFVSDIVNWDWPGLDGAPRRLVSGVVGSVIEMASDLPDCRHLVHGDFGSNNVLVADGELTGVIDWSEAMVGDPLYDLANILFWRQWLDCMEQQCRYFESQEPSRLSDRRRLACYQMHIGLKVLRDALVEEDTRMVAWALARCEAITTG